MRSFVLEFDAKCTVDFMFEVMFGDATFKRDYHLERHDFGTYFNLAMSDLRRCDRDPVVGNQSARDCFYVKVRRPSGD